MKAQSTIDKVQEQKVFKLWTPQQISKFSFKLTISKELLTINLFQFSKSKMMNWFPQMFHQISTHIQNRIQRQKLSSQQKRQSEIHLIFLNLWSNQLLPNIHLKTLWRRRKSFLLMKSKRYVLTLNSAWTFWLRIMMMKILIKNLKIWSLNSIKSLNKVMQQSQNNFKISFETSSIETILKGINKKIFLSNNENLISSLYETYQLLLKNRLKSRLTTQPKARYSWVLIYIKLCQLRTLKRNMKRSLKNMTQFELRSLQKVCLNLNQIQIQNKLKLILQLLWCISLLN